MVRKGTQILICCLLGVQAFAFDENDIGREIRALLDKPSRGLVTGNTSLITHIMSVNHAVHDGGGTINQIHEGFQWEFVSSAPLPDNVFTLSDVGRPIIYLVNDMC